MMVVHTLKHLWRMFLPHEIFKDLYYVVLFICGTFMNALLTGLWEGQQLTAASSADRLCVWRTIMFARNPEFKKIKEHFLESIYSNNTQPKQSPKLY